MSTGNPQQNPYQDVRDGKGRYRRGPEAVARDAQAAELFGQGLTYQEIADELGVTKKNAIFAVQRALRDVVKGPAEKALQVHIDRLEYLYAAAVEVLEADHVMVSHGQIVRGKDGQPIVDSAPKLAAIREARQSLESFRKLTGMDAPSRVSVEAEQLGREIGRLLDTALGTEDNTGDDTDA